METSAKARIDVDESFHELVRAIRKYNKVSRNSQHGLLVLIKPIVGLCISFAIFLGVVSDPGCRYRWRDRPHWKRDR